MGQSVGSAAQVEAPVGDIKTLGGTGRLVVDQVEIIRHREVIKVPEIIRIEEPTTKYVTQEVKTTRYIATEEPTTKYITQEQDTIKYNVKEQETVRYVPVEIKCEKPVLIDKLYEKPVINEKEYTLVTFKDMDIIRDLMDKLPALLQELNNLKQYKLVEEVVRVPKVQYETVPVERVVWVDKHRCKKCGEMQDHAN